MPKLDIFGPSLSILVSFITSDTKCRTDPFRSFGKYINSLEKSAAIVKRWTILV